MAVSKKTSSSKSSSKGLGKGLGRGINALIPEEPAETNEKVIVKEVVVKEPAETKVRLSQVEPTENSQEKCLMKMPLLNYLNQLNSMVYYSHYLCRKRIIIMR